MTPGTPAAATRPPADPRLPAGGPGADPAVMGGGSAGVPGGGPVTGPDARARDRARTSALSPSGAALGA